MTGESFVLVLPLLVLELVLKIICFRDWLHRRRFNGLPKLVWLFVFLLVTLFGPVVYLVYGRKFNDHD